MTSTQWYKKGNKFASTFNRYCDETKTIEDCWDENTSRKFIASSDKWTRVVHMQEAKYEKEISETSNRVAITCCHNVKRKNTKLKKMTGDCSKPDLWNNFSFSSPPASALNLSLWDLFRFFSLLLFFFVSSNGG